MNEKEKQIYSNLPFLILNKNEDPSNYNGSKISDQGRNTKRSIGVSCNDKKQFLTTSISSSVIKQKEIEQQKKLEKKRMAAREIAVIDFTIERNLSLFFICVSLFMYLLYVFALCICMPYMHESHDRHDLLSSYDLHKIPIQ